MSLPPKQNIPSLRRRRSSFERAFDGILAARHSGRHLPPRNRFYSSAHIIMPTSPSLLSDVELDRYLHHQRYLELALERQREQESWRPGPTREDAIDFALAQYLQAEGVPGLQHDRGNARHEWLSGISGDAEGIERARKQERNMRRDLERQRHREEVERIFGSGLGLGLSGRWYGR